MTKAISFSLKGGKRFLVSGATLPMIALLFFFTNTSLQCQKSSLPPQEPWYALTNAFGESVLAVYENKIPCRDCERIKVAVVLYGSQKPWLPKHYALARVMVGKNNDRLETYGSLSQKTGTGLDPRAVYLQFDDQAPPDFKNFWVIGEHLLFILDERLMPKVGDESHGYVLNRIK